MSKKRIRRRPGKFITIPSDDLPSQGPGTWIKLKRTLSMGALQPIMALVNYRRNIPGDDNEAAVQALDGLLDELRNKLPPAIRDWNWLTDCEAEIENSVDLDGTPDCVFNLPTPIWADSSLENPETGEPPILAGFLAYVGQFPDNYDTYRVAGVENDGKRLVLHGRQKRSYTPGEDFILIGLPKPNYPESFAPLDADELVWIVNRLTDRLTAQSNAMQAKKKATPA